MSHKIFKPIIGAILCLLTACNAVPKSDKTTATTAPAAQQEVPIPYTPVENYFIRNTVKNTVPLKISTQEEFDTYFGTATTMGSKGAPTAIDFAKEYVIVVDPGSTEDKMDIEALNMIQKEGQLIFSYSVKQGDKQGFTTHPFLMVRVDKSYTGTIILNKH